LIDARMTFGNESFFHVLRKWGNKHSDFSRHYGLAIWCAVLSWNENVRRVTLEHVWRRRKSGQLSGQRGRFYKVAIRAPQTDHWRTEGWLKYQATIVTSGRTGSQQPSGTVCSYFLGWLGCDPPAAAPIQLPTPLTVTKPLEQLTTAEMKSELGSIGVFPTSSKKPELLQLLMDARNDAEAVRSAAAPKPARTALPEVTATPISALRGSPRRDDRATPAAASLPMVLPLFRLPEPYALPDIQRRRRQPQPAGQKKWTAKRIKAAVERVEAGEEPSPLRRTRGEAFDEPPVDLTEGEEGEAEDDGEEGEEGEEGEDEAMESAEEGDDLEEDA